MSLGAKVLRGSIFMLSLRLLQRTLGFASTLILARVLLPADFGVVAVAMVLVHLADTIADSGARQYLIQRPEINDEIVDTAWSLDIVTKSASSVILLLLLPLLGRIWSEPDITLAIAVLAPTIALRALQNPQLHIDARELSYRNLVFIGSSERIVSFVVVVVAALQLGSWWAMVIGYYAAVTTSVVLSWLRCRRRLRFSLSRCREQWMFSKWILSRGFLGYFRAQADALLIARIFPLEQYGKFSVAREITVMPAIDIVQPLTQPLLSSLSRVRNEPTAAARQLRIAILVVALITAPMCVFLYRFSESLVAVLLGEGWSEAAPMIVAMTPLLFSYSLGGITNNLILSLGRVRTLFLYDLVSLTIVVTVIFIFRNGTIAEVVLARSLTGLIVTGGVTLWVASLVGAGTLRLLLLCCGPAIVALFVVSIVPEFKLFTPILSLICSGAVMFAMYFLLVLLLALVASKRSESWRYLLELAKHFVERFMIVLKRR